MLERAPSFVMNQLISLQRWGPNIAFNDIDFSVVPFWIQIHGLARDDINPGSTPILLNKVGKLLEVDDPTKTGDLSRHFLRARVEVDVTKPLWSGRWIQKSPKEKIWIHFKYERLQRLCYNCGLFGHEQKTCKSDKVMAARNKFEPKYDPFLTITKPKPFQKPPFGDSPDGTSHSQNGSQQSPKFDANEGRVKVDDATMANSIESVTIPATANPIQVSNVSVEPVSVPPSITRIDLEQGLVRAGLGPEHVDQLDLFKEDIGLKQPIIIKDYLSPKKAQVRYGCAQMSQEDVNKVRNFIENKGTMTNKPRVVRKFMLGSKAVSTTESHPAFVVEYPPDDDDDDDDTVNPSDSSIPPIMEEALSGILASGLNLKRNRETQIICLTNDEENDNKPYWWKKGQN